MKCIWLALVMVVTGVFTSCENGGEEEIAGSMSTVDSALGYEEFWMVKGIVEDLQEMGRLAGGAGVDGKVLAVSEGRNYKVGVVAISMQPSCWDTASYVGLVGGWKLEGDDAAEADAELLEVLLTPSAGQLQLVNRTVSARMESFPSSAVVHEEAAFLLGVFGMRESAYHFHDIRELIGRMTAHLAMAEVLRGGAAPSEAGAWAKVLYDVHAGRPRVALEAMEGLSDEGASGRWKTVVEMLVTGDWRKMKDLKAPTLAESIAYARAVKRHRGNEEMMEFVGLSPALQECPEWSRLLIMPSISVEDGHLAMAVGMPLEFAEIDEVFSTGAEPDPAKLAAAIGTAGPFRLVDGGGTVRVISDDAWAGYFRRHLYGLSENVSRFAILTWASMENAAEWEKVCTEYFKGLAGHELVLPLLATEESTYRKLMGKTCEFISKNPEVVPMGLWFDYRFPTLGGKVVAELPRQTDWFKEACPPGTAFNSTWRTRFSGNSGKWINTVIPLHEIDPWNTMLCYEFAENTGNNMESVRKGWGEIQKYSELPLKQILEGPELSIEDRISTLQKFTTIDANRGLDLAYVLALVGREKEAVAAYEEAFENAEDRVKVSNMTLWLINYYKRNLQDAKAREVADHNAEVYSLDGLYSAMLLAIDEKDGERAVKYGHAIYERYGDARYLPAAMWATSGDKEVLDSFFPEGFKEPDLEALRAEPRSKGVRIRGKSLAMTTLGLRTGDVVLAVDGVRVESYAQYIFLMNSKLETAVKLTIRSRKNIREVDCVLPDRRLGVSMSDFGS